MPSRRELATRLRSRRWEIEQALLIRTAVVPGARGCEDPDYREAARSVVPVAFEYVLAVLEASEDESPPVPQPLLTQARAAARHRVPLETVIRGYVAGSALMDDLMVAECGGTGIQSLLRARANALEHLLSRVSSEYQNERRARDRSQEERHLERVKKLLRGEVHRDAQLGYLLDHNHVAVVARGSDSRNVVSEVARAVDCRSLLVGADGETVWAWLGRQGGIYVEEVQAALVARLGSQTSVGIGEEAAGIGGWRLTHRQARASLSVARRSATRLARYADVCLIASALQDGLLASSLRQIYLQPLIGGKDGGAIHLETLRAYFAAHRNGESTASALGISRQAVGRRLRVIEEQLGRPLPSCATAIETVLILDELGH